MTEEQKQRYQDFFDGKAYDDLTEEEKKGYEESLRGKMDALLEAVRPIWEGIKAYFRKVAKAILAWRKKVDEEAAAGNPNALYVQATLELGYWTERLKEVEAKLKVTKQTVARKKILDQQKHVKAQVDKWKQQQIEAIAKAGAEYEKASEEDRT